MNAYANYESAPAHKLLCDNRDRYVAQSAATRDGKVAPLPPRILHNNLDIHDPDAYAREQMADSAPTTDTYGD